MNQKRKDTAPPQATAAPEKPGRPVFLWSGIVGAAAGSLLFNLYHDTHLLATLLIAIPAGVLPPYMTVVLGHAIKEVEELALQVAVFVVTISAMAVSAMGAAPALVPAYGAVGSYLLPITLDCADLILLYALIQHYKRVRIHRLWVAGTAPQHAGTVPPAPAPAFGTDGNRPTAPTELLPGTDGTAPTGTGPAGKPAVPGAGESGTNGARPRRPSAGERQPAGARAPRTADPELCKAVVEEIRARKRPAIEGAPQQIDRCEQIITEFRQRTGERINNQELGLAMSVHKSKIAAIRAAVTEPEGERSEDRQEGTG